MPYLGAAWKLSRQKYKKGTACCVWPGHDLAALCSAQQTPEVPDQQGVSTIIVAHRLCIERDCQAQPEVN